MSATDEMPNPRPAARRDQILDANALFAERGYDRVKQGVPPVEEGWAQIEEGRPC